jgi:hypothetical protein
MIYQIAPIIPVVLFILLIIWLSRYEHKKIYAHKTGLYKISFKSPPKQSYIEWKVKRCVDGKITRGCDRNRDFYKTLDDIELMKSCARAAIHDFLHQQEIKRFRKLKGIIQL